MKETSKKYSTLYLDQDLLLYSIFLEKYEKDCLHPIDRICLKHLIYSLEKSVKDHSSFSQVIDFSFSDNFLNQTTIERLRKLILNNLMSSDLEHRLEQNITENEILECFENWLYDVKTPQEITSIDLIFLISMKNYPKSFLLEVLDITQGWVKNEQLNQTGGPPPVIAEEIREVEKAVYYFLNRLSAQEY